ncbi:MULTISPECIES: hypothetical protein [Corynebacterium]|uniref:hypothetical protein n=1 Tax=Corynebacterium TaxID=1716 RepID=UPI0011AB3636|nr:MULTISPECIES: hypothetical protein [Corynebacterium]
MRDNRRAHTALEGYIRFEYERHLAVAALEASGLLLPEPQVVRTTSQVYALDPDTILTDIHGEALTAAALHRLNASELEEALDTGVAIVVTGAQAREIRRRMHRP